MILVGVIFFVAWLLEDIIFFSLFIGIPAGIISAIIAFVFLTVRQTRHRGFYLSMKSSSKTNNVKTINTPSPNIANYGRI
jgi:MFS superfamily sulfate permease-like transporter